MHLLWFLRDFVLLAALIGHQEARAEELTLTSLVQAFRSHLFRTQAMSDDLFIYDSPPYPATNPWEDTSQFAPTPGNFDRSTACSLSPSPRHTPSQQPSDRLGFLPLVEWDERGEYDRQPPQYICYTIEWKLVLNNRPVGTVTKKDLVVAPSAYWEKYLKPALDNMVQTKKKPNHRVRSESTTIKASVNERRQCPLEDFYNSTNIDWTPMERQLCKWSNLLRIGKRLTLKIAFSFKQDDNGHGSSPARRGEKRGRVSATTTMLAERDAYLAAEEDVTGRPAAWNTVYELMACHVSACQLQSDWCWEDPVDSKHYKLREPHIDRLVDHVEKGGRLESHNDVPRDIRRDLILESHTGRKSKKAKSSAHETPYHPVSINVNTQTPPAPSAALSSPRSSPPELVIRGDQVVAVKNYCRWLESQYTDESYKADFRRARDVILRNHMDLELILDDPDPKFFTDEGIQIGTARRFIRDIIKWDKVVTNSPPNHVADEHLDATG